MDFSLYTNGVRTGNAPGDTFHVNTQPKFLKGKGCSCHGYFIINSPASLELKTIKMKLSRSAKNINQ